MTAASLRGRGRSPTASGPLPWPLSPIVGALVVFVAAVFAVAILDQRKPIPGLT
jgi:hypothetical protein